MIVVRVLFVTVDCEEAFQLILTRIAVEFIKGIRLGNGYQMNNPRCDGGIDVRAAMV